MPVPTAITDLSQTAASNFPAGSNAPSVLDDVQRAHAGFIAMLRDGKGFTNAAQLVCSATLDIGAQNSFFVEVSGTTGPVTSLGTSYNGPRIVKFLAAPTINHNASTLIMPGGSNVAFGAGDSATFVPKTTAGTADGWQCIAIQRADGTGAAPLRGYISGLTMSTAGSSTTMSVSAGQATDSTNAGMITLASAISKTTSAWAVGTTNGGLDTGTIANSTWYHWFLVRRLDTAVVDILFSLSATAPTLPANYTQFRRIGSGRTNGSGQWEKFVQAGDYFRWALVKADVAAVSPGTSDIMRTLTVPPGVPVEAFGNVRLNSADYVYISDPASTAEPADSTRFTFNAAAASGAAYRCRTNISAQVRTSLNSGAATLNMNTEGWIDSRGRDA